MLIDLNISRTIIRSNECNHEVYTTYCCLRYDVMIMETTSIHIKLMIIWPCPCTGIAEFGLVPVHGHGYGPGNNLKKQI
jgi:hypothetical protein